MIGSETVSRGPARKGSPVVVENRVFRMLWPARCQKWLCVLPSPLELLHERIVAPDEFFRVVHNEKITVNQSSPRKPAKCARIFEAATFPTHISPSAPQRSSHHSVVLSSRLIFLKIESSIHHVTLTTRRHAWTPYLYLSVSSPEEGEYAPIY